MWYKITSTDEWLSKLAAKYLGDPMKYNLIYEQNKDLMPNADTVYPGLMIWIPVDGKPRPKGAAPTTSSASDGFLKNMPSNSQILMFAGGGLALMLALFTLPKK